MNWIHDLGEVVGGLGELLRVTWLRDSHKLGELGAGLGEVADWVWGIRWVPEVNSLDGLGKLAVLGM